MEDIPRLKYLFKKYTETNCTARERDEFFSMVVDETYAYVLNNLIKEYIDSPDSAPDLSKERSEQIFEKIQKATLQQEKAVPIFSAGKKYRSWWAAAAIFLLLLSSTYFIFDHSVPGEILQSKTVNHQSHDIAPGHAGAILTLSNGKKIILDDAQNGLLALQGKSTILKRDGQLIYENKNNPGNEAVYNTMTTPKGRKYQLVLSDGSEVWLDAASSITFPTNFNTEERRVEITGEVYFEVKKLNKKSSKINFGKEERMPFIVVINSPSGLQRQIEVLGTHFNIMAYDNEPSIKITLLEGSIKVSNQDQTAMIKPGEQAVLNNQNNKVNIVNTDVDEAVAWKNGMFSFNNATIDKIMRQVERWYDVDVVYDGPKPEGHYRGEVPMNVNASEMLKVLETGGIHFKIDRKKIIVIQ